ncbi:MAG: hypothetical protein RRC34_02860 [Lentisphaeria bacterium]|nr:hypothetical protein [Lentisphaeria bacterium]
MSTVKDLFELVEKLLKRSKDRADIAIIHEIQTIIGSLMQVQMDNLEKLAQAHERNELLLVELAALKKLNSKQEHLLAEGGKEAVRVLTGIEFRKGPRTGGAWLAFCPACHMPAVTFESMSGNPKIGCSGQCGWSVYLSAPVDVLIDSLA